MSTVGILCPRSTSNTCILDSSSIIILMYSHAFIPTDAVAFRNAHFGTGSGPIYLNSVDCSDSESNLVDCSHGSFVSCSRGHFADAGVRCQGRY